ncbi:MAG: ferritin-like domain-containing protein [Gammaproteobacteria bacterium]|nr:ferritin-like domain-containing protein [Gammaproteobacteria bacterium]
MFQRVHQALMCESPQEKCDLVAALYAEATAQGFHQSDAALSPVVAVPIPGRPEKPELIPPRFTKNRPLSTQRGRKTLLHAVTHIEFNAINLALDAAWRFRDMPDAYYLDWLSVAADEARHFQLLATRMAKLDMHYGDLQAHNGLWDAACKTDYDVMVRMALVPRVLEARGLDVTPAMIEKLRDAGDQESVDALEIILREEVGHVEIGSRWFRYCCEQRGLPMQETFIDLIRNNPTGAIRGPYNHEARKQGGFTDWELEQLEELFNSQ